MGDAMKLHQMLSHILKTELNLCQRECKPEFELVNLDNGSQEVRVTLIDSSGNIWTKPKGGRLTGQTSQPKN